MDWIRSLFGSHDLFTEVVGHATYMLLIASMLMRDMAWLRTIAIISALLKIYYRLYLVPDVVSAFWESLFVLVNVGQLLLTWWLNARMVFTEDERVFITAACPNLSNHRARKLLRCGQWSQSAGTKVLTRQGQPVDHLVFVARGMVEIERNGEVVATCGHGDFVGEMSFITGNPASATAIALAETVYLALDKEKVREALAADHHLRDALQYSFNKNLVEKLAKPGVVNADSQPLLRPA